MTKMPNDIIPLTARSAYSRPSQPYGPQRVQQHVAEAARAISAAPRADTVRRRITAMPAHAGRLVGPVKR